MVRLSLRPLASAAAHMAPAKQVYVASKNPVKVKAAQVALQKCFPNETFEVHGVESASGVPDQPVGDEQTLLGARNRIASLRRNGHVSGVLMAVEGGIGRRVDGSMECFAWAAVENGHTGAEGTARSGSFALPQAIADLVDQGMELGEADDKVFQRVKSGQGLGTVGFLSQGLISRTDYYEHCFILALLPFLNPQYYGEKYRL